MVFLFTKGDVVSLLRSLLQDDGIAWIQTGDDFSLGPVGDASFDGDRAASLFRLGIGYFDRGVAVFVVENGLLGNGENVLMLVKDDLGVGGHVCFEFAAGIVDGDANLESGDVVFFNAERRDLGDFAEEGFVFEGFDLDAGGLAEVDLADVRLVDFALDVDLCGIADGHDEGGGGAEDEDGADGIADLDVAREDGALHGRSDGGVAELFFELLERCLGLCDLGLSLAKLGVVDRDLGNGFVAGV